jgi:arylsulfatase A-like enzyme
MASKAVEEVSERPARANVLYMVADDMRNDVGIYGSPAITPHLDNLAQTSFVFTRACVPLLSCHNIFTLGATGAQRIDRAIMLQCVLH